VTDPYVYLGHQRTEDGCLCGWVWPSNPDRDEVFDLHILFVTHPGEYIGRNMTVEQQRTGNKPEKKWEW